MTSRYATQDRDLKAYLTRVNATAHERLREAVLCYALEITRPSPQLAMDVAILWMGAAMGERILFEQPLSRLRRASSKRYVAELADAITGYLTATPRRRSRR